MTSEEQDKLEAEAKRLERLGTKIMLCIASLPIVLPVVYMLTLAILAFLGIIK